MKPTEIPDASPPTQPLARPGEGLRIPSITIPIEGEPREPDFDEGPLKGEDF